MTTGYMPPDVGQRIAHARRARGLTQDQLSQQIGLSKVMISAVEGGRRTPSPQSYQRLLQVLGMTGGGGGDDSGASATFGPEDAETVLAAGWALFYAGQAQAAQASISMAIRQLSAQEPNAAITTALGRCYQLAGVIARDARSFASSSLLGAQAVQLARLGTSVDDLASALFRQARSYQDAGQHELALLTIREAHSLAPRCRNPLRGWLALARVETEAKATGPNPLPMRTLQTWIDLTRAELDNRSGSDASFTQLNRHGISHIEALALILRGNDPRRSISIMSAALTELGKSDPQAHRWRAGMQATEVLAYAMNDDAVSAAALAAEVVRITQSNSHLRYLRMGYNALVLRDPSGASRAIKDYGAVLGLRS